MQHSILLKLLLTLLLFSGSVGCNSVYLSDDIMLDLRFLALGLPGDTLHDPYVPGTHVGVRVHSANDRLQMDGWTMESANPELMEVHASVTSHRLYADCLTKAPGVATLIVRDGDGNEVHRDTVAIEQPDHAELFAHGPLIIGRHEAALPAIQVLTGGTGTFLVEYSHAGHPVYGNGVLGATASGSSVQVEPRTTFFLINREWLSVTALAGTSGDVTIDLTANGQPVGRIPVHLASEADVGSIALAGQDESGARKDDPMAVLLQATDRNNQPIYGVEASFALAGVMQTGSGDLYRYTFDPHKPTMLTASHGGMQASAMLHTGMGYVTSTNVIGCQAAAGRSQSAPGLPFTLGLSLALLLLARRRLGATSV